MSKFFGKTWWGRNWLNTLSNIDYSNRLPRGSSYARNGSITSLHIEGNTIKAKVQAAVPSLITCQLLSRLFRMPTKKFTQIHRSKTSDYFKIIEPGAGPGTAANCRAYRLKSFSPAME